MTYAPKEGSVASKVYALMVTAQKPMTLREIRTELNVDSKFNIHGNVQALVKNAMIEPAKIGVENESGFALVGINKKPVHQKATPKPVQRTQSSVREFNVGGWISGEILLTGACINTDGNVMLTPDQVEQILSVVSAMKAIPR